MCLPRDTTKIIDSGALVPISLLLEDEHRDVHQEACWTVSNIAAGTSEQIQALISSQIMLHLIRLLQESHDNQVREEAAWAISNVASGGKAEQIRMLLGLGCVAPLANLLVGAWDMRVAAVALEGLENLCRKGMGSAVGVASSSERMCAPEDNDLDYWDLIVYNSFKEIMPIVEGFSITGVEDLRVRANRIILCHQWVSQQSTRTSRSRQSPSPS